MSQWWGTLNCETCKNGFFPNNTTYQINGKRTCQTCFMKEADTLFTKDACSQCKTIPKQYCKAIGTFAGIHGRLFSSSTIVCVNCLSSWIEKTISFVSMRLEYNEKE